MFPASGGFQQTTSYQVVLPFYTYAAISLWIATVLLFLHTGSFQQHYFNPYTLAITHTMALGWGTMVIFGASYQLLPVLIEGKLKSNLLAYLTFAFAAIGIPFLVIGFYSSHFDWVIQTGAVLINMAILVYLMNVGMSIYTSKKWDVHAWFILAASIWLFSTTFLGLLLVFNFSTPILPQNSLAYLVIHAHLGIVGWFVLLVIGVASRLIPMFLISKYSNPSALKWIFVLIHIALISFIGLKWVDVNGYFYYLPSLLALGAIAWFGYFCYQAYQVRIRKQVDEQMKVSLLSVMQMLLPFLALFFVIGFLPKESQISATLYGFCIFFGWITAIIFGMTFKTLPFIIWNKVYHKRAAATKTPAPKDLFNEKVFKGMALTYIIGFSLSFIGILLVQDYILKTGTFILLMAATLYVTNIFIILFHKPKTL